MSDPSPSIRPSTPSREPVVSVVQRYSYLQELQVNNSRSEKEEQLLTVLRRVWSGTQIGRPQLKLIEEALNEFGIGSDTTQGVFVNYAHWSGPSLADRLPFLLGDIVEDRMGGDDLQRKFRELADVVGNLKGFPDSLPVLRAPDRTRFENVGLTAEIKGGSLGALTGMTGKLLALTPPLVPSFKLPQVNPKIAALAVVGFAVAVVGFLNQLSGGQGERVDPRPNVAQNTPAPMAPPEAGQGDEQEPVTPQVPQASSTTIFRVPPGATDFVPAQGGSVAPVVPSGTTSPQWGSTGSPGHTPGSSVRPSPSASKPPSINPSTPSSPPNSSTPKPTDGPTTPTDGPTTPTGGPTTPTDGPSTPVDGPVIENPPTDGPSTPVDTSTEVPNAPVNPAPEGTSTTTAPAPEPLLSTSETSTQTAQPTTLSIGLMEVAIIQNNSRNNSSLSL